MRVLGRVAVAAMRSVPRTASGFTVVVSGLPTDPYARNGSPTPFPAAVCQLVGAVDNTGRGPLSTRLYPRDYTGSGVHAPN